MANKKLKAFGLVEVLLGIAIFGTILISATSISIKSLRVVKDNEIADFANGIMIRSLEEAKYDPNVKFENNYDTYYMLTGEIISGDEDGYNLHIDLSNDTGRIQNCEEDKQINIIFADVNELKVCNQIIISEITDNTFVVTSRIVYKTALDWHITEITGVKVQ